MELRIPLCMALRMALRAQSAAAQPPRGVSRTRNVPGTQACASDPSLAHMLEEVQYHTMFLRALVWCVEQCVCVTMCVV